MLVCQLNSQVARRSLKVHVSPSEYNLRTYVSRLTIRALSVLLRLTSHHLLRRGPDSNRRIKVLQTSPLPLGYRAPQPTGEWNQNLERETGFEPATSTLARSHSTTELLPLSRR